MEVVIHTITNNLVLLIVGFSFLIIGIIVPRFKLYWLIAGLNGLPEKDLRKFNLRYIEKYFGIFMLILGVLTIINPFFWTALHRQENITLTFSITTFGVIGIMFVFGGINRKKIYNS